MLSSNPDNTPTDDDGATSSESPNIHAFLHNLRQTSMRSVLAIITTIIGTTYYLAYSAFYAAFHVSITDIGLTPTSYSVLGLVDLLALSGAFLLPLIVMVRMSKLIYPYLFMNPLSMTSDSRHELSSVAFFGLRKTYIGTAIISLLLLFFTTYIFSTIVYPSTTMEWTAAHSAVFMVVIVTLITIISSFVYMRHESPPSRPPRNPFYWVVTKVTNTSERLSNLEANNSKEMPAPDSTSVNNHAEDAPASDSLSHKSYNVDPIIERIVASSISSTLSFALSIAAMIVIVLIVHRHPGFLYALAAITVIVVFAPAILGKARNSGNVDSTGNSVLLLSVLSLIIVGLFGWFLIGNAAALGKKLSACDAVPNAQQTEWSLLQPSIQVAKVKLIGNKHSNTYLLMGRMGNDVVLWKRSSPHIIDMPMQSIIIHESQLTVQHNGASITGCNMSGTSQSALHKG